MKTTAELIKRISPKYNQARKEIADKLWEDLLISIEKVVEKIPEAQLGTVSEISIYYYTKEDNKNIYRSKYAEIDGVTSKKVKYEERDISLGTRAELENAFVDLKEKAEKDRFFYAEYFDISDFCESSRKPSECILDFLLHKVKCEEE